MPQTLTYNFHLPQIIAPQFKHFQKLRDFVEMKLPPGFPVKLDIPVLPTVSARVTFQVRVTMNEHARAYLLYLYIRMHFSVPEQPSDISNLDSA